ncbi:5-3 exoribonuclease 2 [Ceraceosorus bombacis]|uniref:5'-3' exoribonuclease n=1 Tax=Ceraceosorus bombacis TaxID=401625 RepID=A0A0P1BF07_9BASI|nr:5-3 exoribonuclease 2 [Ceraceosorus bombacis]
MGVPALFRWLSKKYPKIVTNVVEEEQRYAPSGEGRGDDGQTDGEEKGVPIPIDISGKNPNGEEFDCLYLDMNGIVHPCTHPEGKPAPETEEDMMLEVFKYTERVVNMVRPRKLLMMAIDGVAPRAKMNQQRSRRFRAAQEAREKEEEMAKALEEWKSRGLTVLDEGSEKKKSWDRNAITPGTPFMDLLAASLRYWVAKKMNEDAGWKNLQVIISDASVPGEGEHKIMDYIRRQRAQPAHDPNTKHVIYGLDADLIMLSLATHEPYFKVLREDVFAQAPSSGGKGCHKCGREGHIAANCIGAEQPPPPGVDLTHKQAPKTQDGELKKPFIFLDVVVLREYLEVELHVPGMPFAFDLERAIDDWVFLIFFVGNDFLPHLPSLEIREGAIDELLRIWKRELPKLGDYLTKHGSVSLKNIQCVMDGIAVLEDDIFRKRRIAEERGEERQKRRKVEDHERQREQFAAEKRARGEEEAGEALHRGGTTYVPVPRANEGNEPSVHGASEGVRAKALAAIESGDDAKVIDNLRTIRMANLSAADRLKAELAGAKAKAKAEAANARVKGVAPRQPQLSDAADDGDASKAPENAAPTAVAHTSSDNFAVFKMDEDVSIEAGGESAPVRSLKRQIEEVDGDVDGEGNEKPEKAVALADGVVQVKNADDADSQDRTDPVIASNLERKVNPDGTVEYEDTVKLWEPGYRERYYQQKFGVGLDDIKLRRAIVKSYVEGLAWVLAYYYQGCPSWTWYYPYHFSPFAADFADLDELDIHFNLGTPFRPYDQLMGVLPAESRASIPPIFHPLMLEEDSEIIDFYPKTFAIDMNGKKMEWQGVAILPFIDEKRLLTALNRLYPRLTPDEVRRNAFGNNSLFVSDEHSLYDALCSLYAKRKSKDPVPLDPALSQKLSGLVMADPQCVPGSTFSSPLERVGEVDISSDRSISAIYSFPEQTTPHKSVLLKGVRPPPKVLTQDDREWTRNGAPDRGRGRGRGRGGPGRGGHDRGGAHSYGGRASAGSTGSHARYDDTAYGPYQNGAYSSPYGSYGQNDYQSSSYGSYGSGQAANGGAYGGGAGAAYGGSYGAPQAAYGGAQAVAYGGYGGYGGGQSGPYGSAYGAGNYTQPQQPAYGGAYGGYGQGGNGQANGGYGGYGSSSYGQQQSSAPSVSHGGYGAYGGAYGGNNAGAPSNAHGGRHQPTGFRGGQPPSRGPYGNYGRGGRGGGQAGPWGQY